MKFDFLCASHVDLVFIFWDFFCIQVSFSLVVSLNSLLINGRESRKTTRVSLVMPCVKICVRWPYQSTINFFVTKWQWTPIFLLCPKFLLHKVIFRTTVWLGRSMKTVDIWFFVTSNLFTSEASCKVVSTVMKQYGIVTDLTKELSVHFHTYRRWREFQARR